MQHWTREHYLRIYDATVTFSISIITRKFNYLCTVQSNVTGSTTIRMSHPSVSFRLALFLSFSLTASSSLPPLPVFSKRYAPSSSLIPKATPSDLLSLLGSKPQSSAVNPEVARDLKSCFKFLVPFSPVHPRHRKLGLGRPKLTSPTRRDKNKLIWWPPEPVLELARLAVDSGGDPAAIHRLLDPTIIQVSFFHFFSSVSYHSNTERVVLWNLW